MSAKPEVVIALVGEFAPRLAELSRPCHLWVLRTPDSEKVARKIWEECRTGERESPTSGITLFTSTGDAEEDLLSVLDAVELHHGIATEQPAANIIRVLGVEPTNAIREGLGSLRFTDITTIPDGFIARWSRSD